ncbi:MAG: hypothetical protein R2854_18870 [Caldilineaceae bacterium]
MERDKVFKAQMEALLKQYDELAARFARPKGEVAHVHLRPGRNAVISGDVRDSVINTGDNNTISRVNNPGR